MDVPAHPLGFPFLLALHKGSFVLCSRLWQARLCPPKTSPEKNVTGCSDPKHPPAPNTWNNSSAHIHKQESWEEDSQLPALPRSRFIWEGQAQTHKEAALSSPQLPRAEFPAAGTRFPEQRRVPGDSRAVPAARQSRLGLRSQRNFPHARARRRLWLSCHPAAGQGKVTSDKELPRRASRPCSLRQPQLCEHHNSFKASLIPAVQFRCPALIP